MKRQRCDEHDEVKCSSKSNVPKRINANHEVKTSALSTIMNNENETIESFLETIWQKKPKVFRCGKGREEGEKANAYHKAIDMGWDGIAEMLQRSRSRFDADCPKSGTATAAAAAVTPPLFFKDKIPVDDIDQIENVYGYNPFLAYLDGCSIVINHADWVCPELAALCLDLQTTTFPHVFANVYLTPPDSSAVAAHADDRDVLVLQLTGTKQWKVSSHVPIPYPYPHEQVGKNGLPIPTPSSTNNPYIIHTTLHPGDVLYMPRGYVHEASTDSNNPSCHVTLALATHDWTFAKTVTDMLRQKLDQIPLYRMAVPLHLGKTNTFPDYTNHNPSINETMEQTIRDIITIAQKEITTSNMSQFLKKKYNHHNQLVEPIRTALITQQKQLTNDKQTQQSSVTGYEVAQKVFMSTHIRASTLEEKEAIPPPKTKGGRGLTVRDNICDSILSILQTLKQNIHTNIKVSNLKDLLSSNQNSQNNDDQIALCDFTLLCFARCCVELGALAVIS